MQYNPRKSSPHALGWNPGSRNRIPQSDGPRRGEQQSKPKALASTMGRCGQLDYACRLINRHTLQLIRTARLRRKIHADSAPFSPLPSLSTLAA
jgi:hypothetical protein